MNCRVESSSATYSACIQSLWKIFTRRSRIRYLTHQSRPYLSLSLSPSLSSFHLLSLSYFSLRSLLETYGEIYYRAWRLASGPYLKQIEEYCLQDLMYSAVNAPRHGLHSLFHSLRKVLVTVFFRERGDRGREREIGVSLLLHISYSS